MTEAAKYIAQPVYLSPPAPATEVSKDVEFHNIRVHPDDHPTLARLVKELQDATIVNAVLKKKNKDLGESIALIRDIVA